MTLLLAGAVACDLEQVGEDGADLADDASSATIASLVPTDSLLVTLDT